MKIPNPTSKATVSAVLLATTFLYGCAPILSGAMNATLTEAEALNKTAQYFGKPAAAIKMSDFQKGALDANYKATVDGKLYNCNIYYGAVQCRQPGA